MEMRAKNKPDTKVLMMINSHISELYAQLESEIDTEVFIIYLFIYPVTQFHFLLQWLSGFVSPH